MDDVLGRQEVICVESNYQTILGGSFTKGVKRMIYYMLDEK